MSGAVLYFEPGSHTYWMRPTAARTTLDDPHGGRIYVPGVTEILKANGFCDFSMISAEVLEHARERGTDVHHARHLLDAGTLDWSTVSEEIGPYLESYLAWRRMFPGRVVFSETALYHPVYRYAGTPDLVYEFERAHPMLGKRPLIDTKAGGHFAGYELQTAAYEAAYNLNARPLERATGRAALFLFRDGKPATLAPHREPSDFRTFLAAQQIYEWRKHHAQ